MSLQLTIGINDDGRRLDRVLRKVLKDTPLSAIHRLLRRGRVLLDDRSAKGDARVKEGSRLTILVDPGDPSLDAPTAASTPPQLPDILYETANLVIIDKKAGVLVHGPDSLEESVREYLKDALPPSLSFKPGPLHRLDRVTSGIIVFSKSICGARDFSEALRGRRLRKRYLAVLDGTARETMVWRDTLVRSEKVTRTIDEDDPEGGEGIGKFSETQVWPLFRGKGKTMALVEIRTGRTHQIRSQAGAHGFPLSGDGKYGGKPTEGGILLHAYELNLGDGLETGLPRSLRAPLGPAFMAFAAKAGGEKISALLGTTPPTEALLDAILA
jgi:23S rRNA pseudouridine955/2504/2580 synthase